MWAVRGVVGKGRKKGRVFGGGVFTSSVDAGSAWQDRRWD